MKPRNIIIAAVGALALGAAALSLGSPSLAQSDGGWGMMGGYGPGWMHGYGPGAMRGYGPQNCPWFQGGTTGYGGSGQPTDLKLSIEDVKGKFEQWIAVRGNPRLKVGEIKEKDVDTIQVDIVTKDNSLVEQFLVNRHTGSYRPADGG